MKGFTQLSLAAFVAYASATAISVEKSDSPLSVVLTASGNTEVKVAVTNKGDKSLNLLSKGTFLDEVRPVEKVTVYSSAGSKLPPLSTVINISCSWIATRRGQEWLCRWRALKGAGLSYSVASV